MIVKDAGVINLMVSVAEHYNTNISTRFLRPLLTSILSETDISRQINDMTERPDQYIAQGIHIDELYEQVLAMSRFIFRVRAEILPNLRSLAGPALPNDANRIYRDMALNNFGANLGILADYVYDLYNRAVEYDRAKSGNARPVYRDIHALNEVPRFLGKKN